MSDATREQIESELYESMESARKRYRIGSASRDEYLKTLKAFNDFAINGVVPAAEPVSE